MTTMSLRARLVFVILGPLTIVSMFVGFWAYRDAQASAAERFDRSLLVTALAISRDTAFSGGDALSPETRDLLRDTSGGQVFYHVYAPDGVYVTGFATPPVVPQSAEPVDGRIYYDAPYQNAPVRALRLVQELTIEDLAGPFTFTVWQTTDLRDGFVNSRTRPVILAILALISVLGLVVWFGVRVGLAPLLTIEDAISSRSPDDLSPIRRSIPPEVAGIVSKLNNLFEDLSRSFVAKNAVISDAAHQLRNPIAGVLSLAEATERSQTLDQAKSRSEDLLQAAHELRHLADSMLTLERANAGISTGEGKSFDPLPVLKTVGQSFDNQTKKANIDFEVSLHSSKAPLVGDPVMFEQAIRNVLHNALLHGGAGLTRIALASDEVDGFLKVIVRDDGKGIDEEKRDVALDRFSQVGQSAGFGLGLPIARAVCRSYGGDLILSGRSGQFEVSLTFATTP